MEKNAEREPVSVSYLVYRDMANHDQWIIKKLVVALIISVVLMFASNLAWVIAWNSYDYTSDQITVDSQDSGVANYTGGNGGIVYGEDYSSQEGENQEG